MTPYRVVIQESDDRRYRFVTQERRFWLFWRSGKPSPWFTNYSQMLEEMHRVHWLLVESATGMKVSRQVRRARARRWGQRRLA